jgi:CRISPR-associated protein Csb1
MWDSTGPRGGLGAKFQRMLVSEITGLESEAGVRPSSRIDPLQIEKEGVTVYRRQGTEDWTVLVEEAEKKDGKPVLFKKEGKPSELNHGNITPSLKDDQGRNNHGGVTLIRARQVVVLSLAGLRRLRFPLPGEPGKFRPEVELAARTVLAALGLAAVCWLDVEGYDLRSRCVLDGAPAPFEILKGGESSAHSLDAEGAARILEEAAAAAVAARLPWPTEVETLHPSKKLKELIRKSREKTTVS